MVCMSADYTTPGAQKLSLSRNNRNSGYSDQLLFRALWSHNIFLKIRSDSNSKLEYSHTWVHDNQCRSKAV
jgi:hypothetical protein